MILQSMTAYGYGEHEGEGLCYTAELRTLNSRYLEVSVRLPRHLLALEVEIINHVKARLKRGKVDVFIDTVRAGTTREMPQLDPEAVRHYLALHREVSALILGAGGSPPETPGFSDLIRLDGVLQSDKAKARGASAAELHKPGIFQALDKALDALVKARKQEGQALSKAIESLVKDLENGRAIVHGQRDQILTHLHKNYLKRLEAVTAMLQKAGQPTGPQPSDERLAAEVTLLSDKADIDEELTRLETHNKEFLRLMATEEAPGRKLDFMCQEMHREVNTMSNKLVQTEVSQHTIEMKQVIERIRQQVQNIE